MNSQGMSALSSSLWPWTLVLTASSLPARDDALFVLLLSLKPPDILSAHHHVRPGGMASSSSRRSNQTRAVAYDEPRRLVRRGRQRPV